MRILFNNNILSGAIQFRLSVMKHLSSLGHEILLVAPFREGDDFYFNMLPSGIRFIPIEIERTSTSPLQDMKYCMRLIKIFKREKPDYIFNFTIKPNIYGAFASKLLRIPCSDMMAGLGFVFTNNNLSSKIARFLYKIGLKCCKKVMILNEANVNTVKELRMCNENKIIWLKGGEGVDLKEYPFYENDSTITTFIFIGRLIPEKGYNEFVDTAKIIKDKYQNVKFQVAGNFDLDYPSGITKSQVNSDVENGYIDYLGSVKNMHDVYSQKGLVVVIPSYYSEGLNRSLMEACACGKPVITTNMPGCKEVVKEGVNGFVVPPRNVTELSDAVMRYLDLPEDEKHSFSINSRCHAEECFDVAIVNKIYEDQINGTK